MKKFLSTSVYLIAVGISLCVLFFVVACTWIGYEVKNACKQAQTEYTGDCIEALSQVVGDSSKPYRQRNSAIWSLGQLGDARALSALQSEYTGNIPDREPIDQTISQYELKKAINLVNGGVNISAIIWR